MCNRFGVESGRSVEPEQPFGVQGALQLETHREIVKHSQQVRNVPAEVPAPH